MMDDEKYKMYDIHMHIIPGVDDGSWSLDMSCSMIIWPISRGSKRLWQRPTAGTYDCHPQRVKEIYYDKFDKGYIDQIAFGNGAAILAM